MIFPDGTIKEGYFDNNVYKDKKHIKPNDIPELLRDHTFNITSLDPLKRKDIFRPVLPQLLKPEKSPSPIKKVSHFTVNKNGMARHALTNADNKYVINNSEYRSSNVGKNMKSNSSSKSNMTIDSSLKKPRSEEPPLRKKRLIKRKKQPCWVPNSNTNVTKSFNRVSRSKLIFNK